MSNVRRTRAWASIPALMGIAVFAAVAAGVHVFGLAAGRNDHRERIAHLHEDVGRLLAAAIDPRFQTKADEINRVATRLVVINAIRGGAIFDQSGHLQETFGESPETALQTVEETSTGTYEVSDPTRLEFYYPPSATGTPFHLLVRVDASDILAMQATTRSRVALVAILAGTVAALAAMIVAWATVAAPVRRIIAAMDRSLADPGTADAGQRLRCGPSEIGILAGQVERFRSQLAEIWRTRVVVANTLLEESPFGVLQLAGDGSPVFANPAAATLFGRDVVQSQAGLPLVVRDVDTGARHVLRDHVTAYRGARRMVEIVSDQGSSFALSGSLMIAEGTRMATTVVTLADVTPVHRARLEALERLEREAALHRHAQRREHEMKLVLECCMTLLAGPDRRPDAHLDATPFATEWLNAAAAVGMVTAPQPTPEGPIVAGVREEIRAVMRLALLVAYARMGEAPVTMGVDVRGLDFETAGVTIKATRGRRDPRGEGTIIADPQIALAALRAAIRRVGGQLSELAAGEDDVLVKFVLRGAAERLPTGMKAAR